MEVLLVGWQAENIKLGLITSLQSVGNHGNWPFFQLTFSWVDYSMNMVDVAISIDVGMCSVVWGEWEAAEGTTLIEVEYINTLQERRRRGEAPRRRGGREERRRRGREEERRRGRGEERRRGGGEERKIERKRGEEEERKMIRFNLTR